MSQFVFLPTQDAKTRYWARKLCPWAVVIAKVEGGFICFHSVADYKKWRNQR
jgi:hypothetical protein